MAIKNKILDLVVGDTWQISRTFTDLPSDLTFTKVYLTLKVEYDDLDEDAAVQVSITDELAATGQITTNITEEGSIVFLLIVSSELTQALNPLQEYYYDFQGITEDSQVYTLEYGKIKPLPSYTDASS